MRDSDPPARGRLLHAEALLELLAAGAAHTQLRAILEADGVVAAGAAKEGIDPIELARAVEERGFESLFVIRLSRPRRSRHSTRCPAAAWNWASASAGCVRRPRDAWISVKSTRE